MLEGKTESGARTVDLLPPLERELAELRARRSRDRDALVRGASAGGKDSPSNVHRRILSRAIEDANAALKRRARRRSRPD